MIYTIAIELGDDNHTHSVIFPDIAGCFSASDNFNDIFDNARQALHLHLEGLVEDGLPLPKPKPFSEHFANPKYKDFTLSVIEIDVTYLLGKAEKINVTLPSLLIRQIDDFVSSNPEYKSRSHFLAKTALSRLMGSEGN